MKFILVAAMMALSSVSKAADLTGQWSVGPITCQSGAAAKPQDAAMEKVIVHANQVTATGHMQGNCGFTIGPVTVTITNDKISPVDPKAPITVVCPDGTNFAADGTLDVMNYRMDGADVILTQAAAADGSGACPAGDPSTTRLTRIP